MLANDNAGFLNKRGALSFFASRARSYSGVVELSRANCGH